MSHHAGPYAQQGRSAESAGRDRTGWLNPASHPGRQSGPLVRSRAARGTITPPQKCRPGLRMSMPPARR